MARLIGALTDAIGPERIRLGAAVRGLQRIGDGPRYRLEIERSAERGPMGPAGAAGPASPADPPRPTGPTGPASPGDATAAGGPSYLDVAGVVLASPAPVSARLLRPLLADVASELDGLRYASVALVALAHRPQDIAVPLDLSGFLVPRSERRFITACSWSSAKFAHLGADGIVRLRASTGRIDDERFVALDDEEIVARVGADLAELMGISAAPLASRVHRWMAALPQYRPGHAARCERWEAALAERAPGVVLAGATLRGLGVPACIASGRAAAARLGDLP